MVSLIAPVERLVQRKLPEAYWALAPIGRRNGSLVWVVGCVSCGKLRVCESANIGRMKRCKSCGFHLGIIRREAMWYRSAEGGPVDPWFRDTDYGYDSTRLAVGEAELMMGSVAAWYTAEDAEACESWTPAESLPHGSAQAKRRHTKRDRAKMSAAAKLRWAKRRQAQAAE